MTPVPLVTIDIGNTRVKVGVFDVEPNTRTLVEPVSVVRWKHGDEPNWPRVLPERAFVGSVAPARSGALIDRMPESWPRPHIITPTMLPVTLAVDAPDRLGVDRAANAAAVALLFPRDDTLVIDAGSAITVDLVTQDQNGPTFRGGAIFPGLQLASDTLTSRTELLPRLDMSVDTMAVWPARNTEDAVRIGVRDAARGAVYHFVSRFRARHTPQCRQVLCGGDAEHFTMGLDEREIYENLTLSGLALADVAGAGRG